MKLYAIVDRKGKEIVSTFTSLNDEMAERSFLALLSAPGHNIITDFPEDFSLYAVADIGYNNGVVSVSDPGVGDLNANGFKVNTYSINESIKSGSDYDRRYLNMLKADIYGVQEDIKEEENVYSQIAD